MRETYVNIYCKNDIKGGAAKATFRLFQALKKNHTKVIYRVDNKSISHSQLLGSYPLFSYLRSQLDSLLVRVYRNRRNQIFSPGIIGKIFLKRTQVNHITWGQGGYISILSLIFSNRTYITLHDCWFFTGGCHVVNECNKYKDKCYSCPVISSNRKLDLSTFLFNIKKHIIKSQIKNIYFIAVSNDIKKKALNSKILRNANIEVIPNCIDTSVFTNRYQNGFIEKKEKVLLFGAENPVKDINKGFKNLIMALDHLELDFRLVIFGCDKPESINLNKRYSVTFLGRLENEKDIIKNYQNADLTIVPSFYESFGQVALESISCGTPVVAFKTGGLSDIVLHKKNGYLAAPYSAVDLAHGIKLCLDKKFDERYFNEYVNSKFSYDVIANKHLKKYEHTH